MGVLISSSFLRSSTFLPLIVSHLRIFYLEAYSPSSPCITVSHNTFAFYSDSRGDYKQDTLILINCGPTGSWGSVITPTGLDSRIHFDMNPSSQSEDGSFPSGAQVTITVLVTADQTLPAGHY